MDAAGVGNSAAASKLMDAANSDADALVTPPIRARAHLCRSQFGRGRTCAAANSDGRVQKLTHRGGFARTGQHPREGI